METRLYNNIFDSISYIDGNTGETFDVCRGPRSVLDTYIIVSEIVMIVVDT